jgi:hypothetical protein
MRMMTVSILRKGWKIRGWWNNLLRREVMLQISLKSGLTGPDDCHFQTASPPHAYPILFLHVYIIFTSIVLLLTEGITPHLLDPFIHF